MSEVCFRNALIIDGNGSSAFLGNTVIQGNKITKVGVSESDCIGIPCIDCDGLSLLPGMIDCHVHLFMDGGSDPFKVLMNQTRDQRILTGVGNALKNLYAGVTTVRECGSPEGLDIMLRDSINSGLVDGPRIFCGGRVITTTGGHGYQIGVEADSVSELITTVRREIKTGVDFIKLMATGGFMSFATDPRIPQFDLEQIRTVVQEAHRANKKVVTHAQAIEGIKVAIEAGVDCIEHGRFLDLEAASLMKEKGIWFVPTLTPSVISKSVISEVGAPEWVVEKTKLMEGLHETCFRIAVEKGLSLAAGTDAGSMYTSHGLMSTEILSFCSLGFSPIDAICAATGWAADLLGISKMTGTIEEGKLADLIVVRGNPLNDPSVLSDPQLVMKDGVIYKNALI